MKRGVIGSSILVILALQLALLLAGAGARSQLADDQPAIRLPTDAKGAGNHAAGEGNDKQKPWGDCCDVKDCTKSLPPVCRCRDEVESCSSACKDCEVSSDPSRYVCHDWYGFDLDDWLDNGIPMCNKQKPWGDCCDMKVCTLNWPPVCRCSDELESCSSTCKYCEEVSSNPPRYVCYDSYQFHTDEAPFEIPKCT